MLVISISGEELYNEETEQFTSSDPFTVELEHSLVSLSKWESKHGKAFLSTTEEKTREELFSYIQCMGIHGELSDETVTRFTQENFNQINDYINSKQSATTFHEFPGDPQKPVRQKEFITSELIYYWMSVASIPFHPAETWHLNRLFSLIRIHSIKSGKQKKVSPAQNAAYRRALNEQRLAEAGTSG